jgi:hypothetical protein
MKNAFLPLTAAVVAIAAAALSACSSLDVVGRQSLNSFAETLKALPGNVAADEPNIGWSLTAPDGAARFIWSADYGKAPLYDVMLEIDAEPFLDAGLDPGRLSGGYAYHETGTPGAPSGKTLTVGRKLGGDDKLDGDSTPLAAYEMIVKNHRDEINYHATLDHYGVKLGDGNMFEWANDMNSNGYDGSPQDKDIVFVLNPEPLMAAGLDPNRTSGWVYSQVPVETNGKTEQVWKLLKPFDLE